MKFITISWKSKGLSRAEFFHPLFIFVEILFRDGLVTLVQSLQKVLFGDGHVQLRLSEVLDLAGLEAGNLPPHAHHAGVPADVGDVRPAIALQLPGDSSQVNLLLHLHFLQVDLEGEL